MSPSFEVPWYIGSLYLAHDSNNQVGYALHYVGSAGSANWNLSIEFKGAFIRNDAGGTSGGGGGVEFVGSYTFTDGTKDRWQDSGFTINDFESGNLIQIMSEQYGIPFTVVARVDYLNGFTTNPVVGTLLSSIPSTQTVYNASFQLAKLADGRIAIGASEASTIHLYKIPVTTA